MTKNTYSISEAQAKLPSLLRDPRATFLPITRHSETVGYIVSKKLMDAIVETMELLADPGAVDAIGRARKGKNRYIPLDRLHAD